MEKRQNLKTSKFDTSLMNSKNKVPENFPSIHFQIKITYRHAAINLSNISVIRIQELQKIHRLKPKPIYFLQSHLDSYISDNQ